MTIDATIAGATSDSYMTTVEALAYHGARLHNDEWSDASGTEREKALKWATRLLDNLNWMGRQWDDIQALRWPRIEVPDREGSFWDFDEIPVWLKNAQAELAWLLLISDPTREAGTKGFHMIKVGPITMQINPDDRSMTIYQSVLDMVNPYVLQGTVMLRG